MLLKRCLKEEKVELLKKVVELATGIQLRQYPIGFLVKAI